MVNNISVNVQSSVKITGDKIIYFDPWQLEENHDAEVIFITHEHSDHFSVEDILKIRKADTIIVAPKSMENDIFAIPGIDSAKCILLVPGVVKEIGKIVVETVPAYNKLKPFHQKTKGWLGYVVNMDGHRYYVAGDTDVTDENKKIKCDIAILPIGGHYTMDKKAAKELVGELRPDVVIPTHYGAVVGSPEDGNTFKEMLKDWPVQVQVLL